MKNTVNLCKLRVIPLLQAGKTANRLEAMRNIRLQMFLCPTLKHMPIGFQNETTKPAACLPKKNGNLLPVTAASKLPFLGETIGERAWQTLRPEEVPKSEHLRMRLLQEASKICWEASSNGQAQNTRCMEIIPENWLKTEIF